MKAATIIKSDLKNIFRDPSLIVIFIVPIFLIAILRILPPIYEPFFPVMIEYRPLILGTFGLLVSGLSGFLMAFVMLDEKDQQLFEVFRVMPFSFKKLILLRILSMFITGFILCFTVIKGAGLVSLNLTQVLVLSFLCALSGPANTMLIVSFANNKIEGATYFKLLNMFIMAPMVSVFIIGAAKYLLGVFPFFWVFQSFMNYQYPTAFYLHVGLGILSHLAYLAITFWMFFNKNK